MSVTDVAVRRESGSESIVELVRGLAVVVLTILGLAEVSPTFLVAIATIVFGVALLLYGTAALSQLNAALARYAASDDRHHRPADDGGIGGHRTRHFGVVRLCTDQTDADRPPSAWMLFEPDKRRHRRNIRARVPTGAARIGLRARRPRMESRQVFPAKPAADIGEATIGGLVVEAGSALPNPARGKPWTSRGRIVMSYASVSPALMRLTHHLDVAPMILALQFQPADFEYRQGRLRHIPSRRQFLFDRSGRVAIDALCGCAGRSISSEQGEQLFTAFKAWQEFYWRPLETDREFASHFRAPNAWVRLYRDMRMAWLRFMRRADSISLPAEAMPVAPAE
jgi:hypothetical protein